MFSDVLLTVDFDRTLTAPDSTIPERNLEAIRYFIDNGGTFTVNTGRSVPMASNNILGIVQTNAPLLLYNGSAAYDTDKQALTLCRPIDLDITAATAELQAAFPELTVEVQGIDAHYTFRKDPRWEAFCDHNHCAWNYKPAAQIPGPFIKFSMYGEFREPTVASLFEATDAELALFEKAIAYVESRWGDKVDVFRACARIADIHAKGASKLRIARDLQQSLGKKILVCVGDAENDLTMLEGADFAFSPADGVVADRFENVCCCADGAVADVIYKKIPQILQNKP